MAGIVGDHICDAIRAHGRYERVFLDFIRDSLLEVPSSRNQVAIDVGANIGNHTLFFSDLFKRVIAFEPNPLARSLLQLNLELNSVDNVEVRQTGLSDRAGTATLAFDHTNLGAATASINQPGSGQLRSSIELVVGDDAIEQSMDIGFIKIDVEGAEEAVLKGLEKTIRTHRPIMMLEQWADEIDGDSGTSSPLLFLQEQGYSAWELVPSGVYRGKLGKLTSLLLGHTDYRLERINRLEKRDYRALFFLPPEG